MLPGIAVDMENGPRWTKGTWLYLEKLHLHLLLT
jgi:hypothetical protein